MKYQMPTESLLDKMIAVLIADFYKFGHPEQYPDNTEHVYSTWTPRATRIGGVHEVAAVGPQKLVQFLHWFFQETDWNHLLQ